MKTIFTILLIFSHFSFSDSLGSETSQKESSSVTDNELNDPKIALEQAYTYLKQKNYEQAVIWLEKAALQNDVVAQFNLGLMYYTGKVIPQDYKQALFWMEKAALQNNIVAQYVLGHIYYKGKGVPQDDNEAYVWFHLSEANGYAQATEYKNKIAQNLTPEQLALAQQRSDSIAQQIKQK